MKIIFLLLFILGIYASCLVKPIYPDEYLLSQQEKEKSEEIISKVIKTFKEKNYDDLYNYYFIPPYFDTQDINADKQYIIGLLKTFEELGDLEECSSISVEDIPDNWICYGERGFLSSGELKSLSKIPKMYLKVYKTIFQNLKKEFFVYALVYIGPHQLSIRQFGIIYPFGYEDLDDEEIQKEFSIPLQLYLRIIEYYANSKSIKVKTLADTPQDVKSNGVHYYLPTKEGEFLDLGVDYKGDDEGAELQLVIFTPPSKLDDGEKNYTLLTRENKPLKIIFKFKDKELISAKLDMESPKEGEAQEVVTAESRGGFIIKFNFRWENGELIYVRVEPETAPFLAGTIFNSYGM